MNNSPVDPVPAEYSISYLSRVAGISSRTLRHYDHIGLLVPDHVAQNGYRFYTQNQLVRLQRILLLRDMGLKLESITEILDDQRDEREALAEHVQQLQTQRRIIDRQITTLERTISALENGEEMKPETSFDGFNEQYKEEVTQRWGAKAYNDSNQWWRSKSAEEQAGFFQQVRELNEAWIRAGEQNVRADSDAAQSLAARHVQWLRSVPGTPLDSSDLEQRRAYVSSLSEMYVADDRFAKNYGGHAELVRDALKAYVQKAADL
ncbi:MerR family transcriptional regulator [Glutamicibacter halophytocola]|uniref:MerR family transcriptional regulator n=1 Tax=Glutamicibacter halophytocola TaxID=1933880 RepID=A0ABX5Y9E7_9MICC|nr:MerR family transcriptional regulator [Glutamicibacter halophytocola]NQD40755.1 MerR family transcriptional regulator [Glutamicibacter halophytocola]QDY66288.1 MerR family transcriptional regulator [Glutamicibacter halophytocola]